MCKNHHFRRLSIKFFGLIDLLVIEVKFIDSKRNLVSEKQLRAHFRTNLGYSSKIFIYFCRIKQLYF